MKFKYDDLIQQPVRDEEDDADDGYVFDGYAIVLRNLADNIYEDRQYAEAAIDNLPEEDRNPEAPRIKVTFFRYKGHTILLFKSGNIVLFCSIPNHGTYSNRDDAEKYIDDATRIRM